MSRYKALLIAVIITAFMFVCFINSSHADKIVEFPSDTEDYSWSGYTYHTAYLKTDVPYTAVDWYIGDWQYQETDQGDGVTKEAYFSPYDKIPGEIKGKKYEITAKVWFPNTHEVRSYKVRMFEPKIISGTKKPVVAKNLQGDGIYGYVELRRHYHDGSSIVVEAYLSARNKTKISVRASSWLRHTRFAVDDGRTLWTTEDPGPSKDVPPGEIYSNSGSSMISYWVGGDIEENQEIKLNAHIHLQVSGQVWHEENNAWTHTFTHEDNESYEGD